MSNTPIEGSPLQSFLRFNDQNGNLLISLNKDGSITLAAGVNLAPGNTVVTTSSPYGPGYNQIVLPSGQTVFSFGPIDSGAYISGGPSNVVIQDLQNGAGDSISFGTAAQEEEDAQTGILIETGPHLDTVISNGSQTWRFDASSRVLLGTENAGIVGTQLQSLTVAQLPGAYPDGGVAWASNGRATGEGPGSGTGVPVYCKGNVWKVYSTDSPVQS